MPRPRPNMPAASSRVPAWFTHGIAPCGITPIPAMTAAMMKPMRNHGTSGTAAPRAAPPSPPAPAPSCSVPCPRRSRQRAAPTANARSATRPSLIAVAVATAVVPTRDAAATTCATSWMLAPAQTPINSGASPSPVPAAGIARIISEPNRVTMARATPTSSSRRRIPLSTAAIAAAPQMAKPLAMSVTSPRSRPRRSPITLVRANTATTVTTTTTRPGIPSMAIASMDRRVPSSTTPSRRSVLAPLAEPVISAVRAIGVLARVAPRISAMISGLSSGSASPTSTARSPATAAGQARASGAHWEGRVARGQRPLPPRRSRAGRRRRNRRVPAHDGLHQRVGGIDNPHGWVDVLQHQGQFGAGGHDGPGSRCHQFPAHLRNGGGGPAKIGFGSGLHPVDRLDQACLLLRFGQDRRQSALGQAVLVQAGAQCGLGRQDPDRVTPRGGGAGLLDGRIDDTEQVQPVLPDHLAQPHVGGVARAHDHVGTTSAQRAHASLQPRHDALAVAEQRGGPVRDRRIGPHDNFEVVLIAGGRSAGDQVVVEGSGRRWAHTAQDSDE